MADGSADVQAAVVRTGVVDQTVKAGVCLGGLGNRSHGLQRLDGVLARGGFTGEHDRAGAVVDGVGHVGDLGTGRAGVDDHGIQHLGSGNADLTGAHGAVDQVLLDGRDLGKVDLNAHIAAGNHDAVGHSQNLVDVVDALLVLDLRDDADLGVVLVQDVADIHNVLRVAGKAGGDQVKALLDTKKNIARVALAHIRHGQMHAGDVDALLGLDDAVIADRADNVGVADLVNAQLDQTVVQHDPATGLDVVGQLLVSDGADFVRALYAAGGQGELLAGGQLLHTVLELTQTNLGTLGVQHTGNGQVQFLGQCAYLVIAALVLLVVAMRKVETRDVHAVLHQLAQNARLIGGRTHSTDDLGFTHKAYPPFYISTYLYTLANLSGIILQVRRGRQEGNGFRLKKTAQKLFPCCPLIFTQFQLVPCKFCHSPGTARLTGHRRSSVPGGSDLQAWIACLLFAVFTV